MKFLHPFYSVEFLLKFSWKSKLEQGIELEEIWTANASCKCLYNQRTVIPTTATITPTTISPTATICQFPFLKHFESLKFELNPLVLTIEINKN